MFTQIGIYFPICKPFPSAKAIQYYIFHENVSTKALLLFSYCDLAKLASVW